MSTITVVPLGICHTAWNGSFYPDDLPDSWRLKYFANEFSTCCLTTQDIEILSSEAEDFACDLPRGFRCSLYLEEPRVPSVSKAIVAYIDVIIIAGHVSPTYLCEIEEFYGQAIEVYSLESGRLPLCHTFDAHAQLHYHLVSSAEAKDLAALKNQVNEWLINDIGETFILVDSSTDIVLLRNIITLVSMLA